MGRTFGLLNRKFEAREIQCRERRGEGGRHIVNCAVSATIDPKAMEPDIRIEVDNIDVNGAKHTGFSPTSRISNSTYVARDNGGIECAVVLGGGKGSLSLNCDADGDVLIPDSRPDGFEESAKERSLEYDIKDPEILEDLLSE